MGSPLVQVGLHLTGQERSGRVDRPFPQLACVVGELGLAGGVTPEEMEPVRVLAGHCEQRAGSDAPRPLRVPDHELLGESVEHPLEHRSVQLFLGVEVAVDDELRDARRGGDVLHGGGGVAGAGEGTGGTTQDGLLTGGAW